MAVDVGSAVGYLDLDISGFVGGLKSAQVEASKSATKLESVGQKFVTVGDKIAGVGVKLGTLVITPLAGAVTAVIKSYADMEQALGGIETLFKDSALDVIANAETAYKRAGTSAVEYMEQVTSFSASLLQSAGGDTAEAARIADMAMVDMSDNANKFGTAISSIQNAYQGFAKQNYTMLDNLKLGYGGTKEEMERLLIDAEKLTGLKYDISSLGDVYEAVHAIQVEMEVTGTTAIEATETISGSFGMAKAAIFDFLANLGSPGADMDKFKNNMIESIKVVVDNIKDVLGTIWENIPLEGWQKNLIVVTAAAGPVLAVVGKLTTGIGHMMSKLHQVPKALASVKTGFSILKGAIAGVSLPMVAIVVAVGAVVAAFANLWRTNEQFREKMVAIWDAISAIFASFVEGVVDRFAALEIDFSQVTEALSQLWNGFCELLTPLFEGAFEQLAAILEVVSDVILGVLDVFIGLFTGSWEQMAGGIKKIFSGAWNFVIKTLSNAWKTLRRLFDAICSWFDTTWEQTWQTIEQFFVGTWNSISSFFKTTVKTIVDAAQTFVGSITTFFSELPLKVVQFLTTAYNAITTWGTNVVAKGREVGENFVGAIVEFFTDLPYKIGFLIGAAFVNVTTWASEMEAKAKEAGTKFLNAVVSFFKQLPGRVLKFVTSAYQNVTEWSTDMIGAANDAGKKFLDTIVDFFTQLPGKIQQFVSSALSNVTVWATNMGTRAREAGTNFINTIVTYMTELPVRVKQYLDNTINNLVTWVGQMGAKGMEAIKSLIDNVVEGAREIPTQMAEIGTSIVEGVWKGIQDAASWFARQVNSFFRGIVDGAKSALGVKSPSSVMADQVGKWLPAGIAVGFERALPSAVRDIQTALNKGIDDIDADDIEIDTTASVASFADSLSGIYGAVASWFESIELRITKSVDEMIEKLAALIATGRTLSNFDGTLGYVGPEGFVRKSTPAQATGSFGSKQQTGGDTYNFYSNEAITEVEAARQLKKAKRDLEEGF